ncbi:MAG: pyrimidine-nucleoside phosphorylase, partial [Syntrophomonadaceae bacterium]|nr:pyrimidine-nucleoside phosphorylase [Syntrophomonadaceae bacterium]
VLTNMNQPLGHEVGNANEVKEAIQVLKNQGAEDETEVALTIASYMAILGGAYKEFSVAYADLKKKLESGEAINKFRELVKIQGGDPEIIDNFDKLPQAKYHIEIKAGQAGYIEEINAEQIGIAAMQLGAGRQTKEDAIDFAAGVTLVKKVGAEVRPDDVICILHTNKENWQLAEKTAKDAYKISDVRSKEESYVYDVIS